MDPKQFEILSKKLDKMAALLTVQGIENKDEKIYALKKMGLPSNEVAPLVGMTDNGVRSSRGWKKQ